MKYIYEGWKSQGGAIGIWAYDMNASMTAQSGCPFILFFGEVGYAPSQLLYSCYVTVEN